MTQPPPDSADLPLMRALLEALPLGVVVCDGTGRILEANATAEAMLGLGGGVPATGSLAEAAWELVDPEGRPLPSEAFPPLRTLREGIGLRGVELGLTRPGSGRIWLGVTSVPVPDGRVLATFEDIGRRLRGAAVLRAHIRLVDQAERLGLEALLRATLDELEVLTGSCIGFYHFVDDDQTTLHLQAWSTRTEALYCRAEGKGSHYPVGQAGIWADAVRLGHPVIHNDYATAPDKRGLPAGHAELVRELVVPVLRSGRVRAVLGVGNKATPYDDGDVASVQRLADLAWELAALKLARAAAEQRAEMIENISASAPGLVHAFRMGPDGTLSLPYLTPAAETLYGLPLETISQDYSTVMERTHPEDQDGMQVAVGDSARDLTPFHRRWRYRHPAKGWRWFEGWSVPRREADGGTLWYGFIMDVTSLAEAEEALLQSEQRYRGYFELGLVGMAISSPGMGWVQVNEELCKTLGYSREELAGVSWTALTHPDDLAANKEQFRRMMAGEIDGHRMVKRFIRKDGSTVAVDMSVRAVRRPDGSVDHFVVMFFDLTGLRQAEASLRESEARLESAFEHSPYGMALVDLEGRYLKVNRELCRMVGRSPAEVLALGMPGITHPEDFPADRRRVQEMAAGGSTSAEIEKRYLHRDGHEVWAQVNIAAVLDDSGRPRHIVSQMQDITGRKQADRERAMTLEVLQALNQGEDLGEAADAVLAILQREVGVAAAVLRTGDGADFEVLASRGLPEGLSPEEACPPGWETAPATVLTARGSRWSNDAPGPGCRSLAVIPVPAREGVVGLLQLQDPRPGLFSRDLVAFLEGLASSLGMAIARHRVQVALQVSEARHRMLADNADDVIWTMDLQGHITYASPSVERLRGYTPEEVLNQGIEHLLTTESMDRVNQVFARSLEELARTGELPTFRGDVEQPCKDGSTVWTEVTTSGLKDEAGRVVGILGVTRDITARRQAEAVLRATEARFTTIFQSAPVLITLSDLESGRFLEVNDAFCRVSGFSRTEVLANDYVSLGWIDEPTRNHLAQQRRAQGSIRHEPLTACAKDGRPVYCLYSGEVVEVGGQPALLSIALDITERRNAEEALLRSEQRFSRAFQNNPVAMAITRVQDGRMVDVNEAWEELSGYSRDLVVGRPLSETGEVFEDEERAAMLGELQRSGALRSFPVRITRRDGVQRDLLMSAEIVDLAGEPCVISSAQDITEQRRAERALRESEARFRGFWEHTPVAVCEEDYSRVRARFEAFRAAGVTDLEAHLAANPADLADLASRITILELNGAILRLFKIRPDEDMSQGLARFFGPESLPGFRAELAALYLGLSAYEHETTALDAQGQRLDLLVRVTVVPGREADLGRVLVSFSDLTDRKSAEADRQRLERELNHLQRLESLGRLAGGVSHDMNNVLGAIMAVGSLLKLRHKDDPVVLKDAEALLQAAVRGRDLVKGLRDFSRKELESATDLDLNDLARREADLLERTTLKRVTVELDLDPDLDPVYGESSTISNALMNLCLNACDAMPEGGTIRLITRNLGDSFVELAVQDDGEGMPPEVLARAMEPFYTTKPAGKGTGLGLSQVYGAMKAHGGTLDIQSRPKQGTRVSLAFPTAARPAGAATATATTVSGPARSLQVLMVDDEELIRRTIVLLLEAMGHRVETATSGLEALRRLEAGMPVDLAMLDVNMPGMDGLETLSRLRILRPELPVVIATGFADERIPGILKRFPKVRILKKPFGISDLEQLLAGWP